MGLYLYLLHCYPILSNYSLLYRYWLNLKRQRKDSCCTPRLKHSILQGGPQIKRSYKLKNSFKKSLKLTRVTKSLFASVSNKWWEFSAPQHKLSCKDNFQEKKLQRLGWQTSCLETAETNQAAWTFRPTEPIGKNTLQPVELPSGSTVCYRFTTLWTVIHPGWALMMQWSFESFLL